MRRDVDERLQRRQKTRKQKSRWVHYKPLRREEKAQQSQEFSLGELSILSCQQKTHINEYLPIKLGWASKVLVEGEG